MTIKVRTLPSAGNLVHSDHPLSQNDVDNNFATVVDKTGDTMTGRLTLAKGATGGIAFPDDAYGGLGDTASITLQQAAVGSTEATELTITVSNDVDDIVNIKADSGGGEEYNNALQVNHHVVLNAANFTDVAATAAQGAKADAATIFKDRATGFATADQGDKADAAALFDARAAGFATAAQGTKADAAAIFEARGAGFATSAQGAKADAAAIFDARAAGFATAAQGAKADTALQSFLGMASQAYVTSAIAAIPAPPSGVSIADILTYDIRDDRFPDDVCNLIDLSASAGFMGSETHPVCSWNEYFYQPIYLKVVSNGMTWPVDGAGGQYNSQVIKLGVTNIQHGGAGGPWRAHLSGNCIRYGWNVVGGPLAYGAVALIGGTGGTPAGATATVPLTWAINHATYCHAKLVFDGTTVSIKFGFQVNNGNYPTWVNYRLYDWVGTSLAGTSLSRAAF